MITQDLFYALDCLRKGNLIGLPTETVYGLAGNAFDPQVVSQIFEVKNRPHFDPLIVHTDRIEKVFDFVEYMPPKARILAEKFWAGAITLVLPRKPIIPDLVTSGLETVAVRIPNHPLALRVLAALDFPLAAPSANPFGYVSPTQAQHVEDQLGAKIGCVLDGGNCEIGIESTIIGFENETPVIYRQGGITVEQIEAMIGKVQVQAHSSSQPKAAGMLASHYSPKKPFVIGQIPFLLEKYANRNMGILSFEKNYGLEKQIILSEKGNLAEAAQRLFGAMRELDRMNIDLIISELTPETGLGRAINDRLRRAGVSTPASRHFTN